MSDRPVVEVRAEVRPAWPVRLPGGGMDGLSQRRGGVWLRLIHLDGRPVELRAAARADGGFVLGARAERRRDAEHGVGRLRFMFGVDEDLTAFRDAFADDPVIGASVRRRPWLRARRRPSPFEALAWAVTEQLIEYDRAVRIQRRIIRGHGRDAPVWAWAGLRDAPDAATVAAISPARLQSYDLSAGRALSLVRAAREVASGRVDLDHPEHEHGWARLRAIPGIGAWTVEVLAILGQGRDDIVPAGDLGYLKVLGAMMSGGDPRARATEEEVRSFMARYDPWAGLAGVHLLQTAMTGSARLVA